MPSGGLPSTHTHPLPRGSHRLEDAVEAAHALHHPGLLLRHEEHQRVHGQPRGAPPRRRSGTRPTGALQGPPGRGWGGAGGEGPTRPLSAHLPSIPCPRPPGPAAHLPQQGPKAGDPARRPQRQHRVARPPSAGPLFQGLRRASPSGKKPARAPGRPSVFSSNGTSAARFLPSRSGGKTVPRGHWFRPAKEPGVPPDETPGSLRRGAAPEISVASASERVRGSPSQS